MHESSVAELLGDEIFPPQYSQESPYNAEICNKSYLKYKVSPSKFAGSSQYCYPHCMDVMFCIWQLTRSAMEDNTKEIE